MQTLFFRSNEGESEFVVIWQSTETYEPSSSVRHDNDVIGDQADNSGNLKSHLTSPQQEDFFYAEDNDGELVVLKNVYIDDDLM